jgi:betaine-aldehyde dehydrogenase
MVIKPLNPTQYGLAGAVFSQDEDVLMRVANALQCGMVWQNCSQPCFPHLPWGGPKLSGVGRDLGEAGLNSYLEPKQVVRRVVPDALGWYDMSAKTDA